MWVEADSSANVLAVNLAASTTSNVIQGINTSVWWIIVGNERLKGSYSTQLEAKEKLLHLLNVVDPVNIN